MSHCDTGYKHSTINVAVPVRSASSKQHGVPTDRLLPVCNHSFHLPRSFLFCSLAARALAHLSFVLYSKIPEELQVQSGSGRAFSVVSLLAMAFLLISHYNAYVTQSTRTYVTLDSHQEDQLRINFNVSLVAVPCRLASVDLSDHMGQQLMNITRHVRHFQLASSKTTQQISRREEIVMDSHVNGVPTWGGVERRTHEGVHYSTPLTTANYYEFMAKYELVLVNYYAPWCRFCQQLNPEWERAAAQLQDHPEYAERVVMASVDCTDEHAATLCRRAHIRAFPSMLVRSLVVRWAPSKS
jgi:thiol-disulfide isomerase/thioredoxin